MQTVSIIQDCSRSEQGALWDPTLRGSIQGLSLQHTANDLARAFLEGVCFEIRRCVDVLAETAPSRTVIVTGHLVDHPSSLQMLADILRQPIRPFRSGSAAALGAAAGALCLIDPRYKLQLFSTVSAASTASAAEETQPSHHSALYQSLFSDYLSSTA